MEKEIVIQMKDCSFTYEDNRDSDFLTEKSDIPPALRNVNLTIRAGEYIAVLGHNGSGKSTLAKIIDMILLPSGGTFSLFGREVTSPDFTEDDMYDLQRKIGMVFQNPDNQIVATVVEEDVAFGPENLGFPSEEIQKRVDEALTLVDMVEYRNHAPHKLSGGQKQRVAIAGVIAMHPEIVIFDESTAMLDPVGRASVISVMETLHKDGATVIHITHDMTEAARAERIVIMNDGQIVLDGDPKTVFSNVSLLHQYSLSAPDETELLTMLKTAGFDIDAFALTPKACCDAILNMLRNKNE